MKINHAIFNQGMRRHDEAIMISALGNGKEISDYMEHDLLMFAAKFGYVQLTENLMNHCSYTKATLYEIYVTARTYQHRELTTFLKTQLSA